MRKAVHFNNTTVVDLLTKELISTPFRIRTDLRDSHMDATLAKDGKLASTVITIPSSTRYGRYTRQQTPVMLGNFSPG